jgi:hypothetical protein
VATWETGLNGRIIFKEMFRTTFEMYGLDSLDVGLGYHCRLIWTE